MLARGNVHKYINMQTDDVLNLSFLKNLRKRYPRERVLNLRYIDIFNLLKHIDKKTKKIYDLI